MRAPSWPAVKVGVGIAASALAWGLGGLAVRAQQRTTAPNLGTPQGAASVNETLKTLMNHRHTGRDGSRPLQDPYIYGTVILSSPNGSCWSCGPDNAGTWACASTSCP